MRQQWTTYRDTVVYHLVVRRAHLFPLTALMLHGIVVGAVGQARVAGLNVLHPGHFADEVRTSSFGVPTSFSSPPSCPTAYGANT